ncbi:cytochrome P450 [Schizopora paradoxa]|uniref:Cytochrome P450 n=1 Tax=Schizopora paradoxa TaxID=27342 RepID=A0A0H2S260_9AGAM|nr:cytochrome P450 [Schizopora paradoxa]
MLLHVFAALLLAYVLKRLLAIYSSDYVVNKKLPKLITLFPFMSIRSVLIPPMPLFRHYGISSTWSKRNSIYRHAHLKTIIQAPFLYGKPSVLTSSVEGIRQIAALNGGFGRTDDANGTKDLCLLGLNLIGAEGEQWRRHRRICSPAFNRNTYRGVWDSTVKVYEEMIDKEGWDSVQTTGVVNVNSITHKLALFIIAINGFGMSMTWEEQKRDSQNMMTLQEVIYMVSSHIFERSRTPKLLYAIGLPFFKRLDEAYTTFDMVMREKIKQREDELTILRATPGVTENEIGDLARDVFGCLVNSRMGASEGRVSMSDDEIISNCFGFMFAGHETTANTLAATMGMLAVYPEAQEYVYRGIVDVLGDREPTFDDFDSLTVVQACFLEGLRMFPSAFSLFRHAVRDATLNIPCADDPSSTETIHIKKGTSVSGDFIGLSYDPEVFSEPNDFNPRRWLEKERSPFTDEKQADEDPTRGSADTIDGFMNFSIGPRQCIGHKFAKIEAVAFLTHLLRSWRIIPVLRPSETHQGWRARVLEPHFVMTLTLGNVPVKFTHRTS